MNFLETIVRQKRINVEESKGVLTPGDLMSLVSEIRPKNDFRKCISRETGGRVKIIAEIKRASPSKGIIAASIDPVAIAKDYEAGGASAVSVLTENNFFSGSTKDLQGVRDAVPKIPVLRKDFIIDEYQIHESLLIGADAVLFIAAALSADRLKKFIRIAKGSSLGALVEVHDMGELDTAISAGADTIGVNNRNLTTFEVSRDVSERLGRNIPKDVVSVSESGINDPEELSAAADMGYHAVLIGEHFMRAADRVAEVKRFTGGRSR
ncbi:MAG TPA: indole-3-glycerol phosphate synthase TrpC [Candidatus Kryptonia bacterium]